MAWSISPPWERGCCWGCPERRRDAILDNLLLLPPATNKKPGVLYSKDTIWHGPFLHLGRGDAAGAAQRGGRHRP